MPQPNDFETPLEVMQESFIQRNAAKLNEAPKGRVTVVETIYHQTEGVNPTAHPTSYSRPLESDEQAYVRNLKLSDKWVSLDTGWVESPHMVLVQNEEGKNQNVIPSQEEVEITKSKIVEIGSKGVAFFHVRPGESSRFSPADVGNLQIRCASGSCKCLIIAIPR